MRLFNKELNVLNLFTAFAGIMGCMVVGFGLYASATHYLPAEHFSPVNHFISELGLSSRSSMAYVFNKSLMTGGFLLMIFVMGVGYTLSDSRLANAATIFGFISTISFSAVGYYTGDNWIAHMSVASAFFGGAMLSVLLFSIAIIKTRQSKLHPSLGVYGFIIVAWYLVALLWPKELLFQSVYDPEHFVRPDVWILTILEWGYCFILCSWILSLSLNLLYLVRVEYSHATSVSGN